MKHSTIYRDPGHALVVIEGADFVGKTSQACAVAEWLGAALFRYPDRRTPVGRLIDDCLAERKSCDFEMLALQALFAANRLERQPTLLDQLTNKHVVADRYWMSSYAYGWASGLEPSDLLDMNAALYPPQVAILLDVPTEVRIERRKQRLQGANLELFEHDLEHMESVGNKYRVLWKSMIALGESHWHIIECGNSPAGWVSWRIKQILTEALGIPLVRL